MRGGDNLSPCRGFVYQKERKRKRRRKRKRNGAGHQLLIFSFLGRPLGREGRAV